MTKYTIFAVLKSGSVYSIIWDDLHTANESFTKWVNSDLCSKLYMHEHTPECTGVLKNSYEE